MSANGATIKRKQTLKKMVADIKENGCIPQVQCLLCKHFTLKKMVADIKEKESHGRKRITRVRKTN